MTQYIWILTREENDYDQSGEYFECAWLRKPTHIQILQTLGPLTAPTLQHIVNGGGRENIENTWYHLHRLVEGEMLCG